ncbi:hypothetical protein NTGM5_300010 [Candidatus Nitrotoga sp. M5]|nr:hypothetical protein NTGM5_300010 [Candidatus Nitrotoga sp. M5]
MQYSKQFIQSTSINLIFVSIPRYSKRVSLIYQIYAAFNFLLAPYLACQRGKQANCEAALRKIEFLEAPRIRFGNHTAQVMSAKFIYS